jgi:hypothetical protein
MKRIYATALIISCLLFGACQKEIDWGLGNSSTANKLLVMISSRTGIDSTIIEYTYNANKKLVREKTDGIAAGTDISNDLVINRNSSGIITTTVQKAAALTAVGIDSVVIRYNYSTSTST